jgi:hypothetical protein
MNPDTNLEPAPLPAQTPEQAARLRAIAERQGTQGKSSIENLRAAGARFWETDEEFDQFMHLLRDIRSSRG